MALFFNVCVSDSSTARTWVKPIDVKQILSWNFMLENILILQQPKNMQNSSCQDFRKWIAKYTAFWMQYKFHKT